VVAAVAGNHDTLVLPRLAAEIDRFHLLGPAGTWSTLKISGDQGFALHLAGWSFPTPHHSASPLLTAPPAPVGVTLGLLHADLDASRSAYAPVSAADLKNTGYRGWFLGHVHKPGDIPGDGAPFYLGSVTGLDPAETGLHGPVLVEATPDGAVTARRLPLAPLRWEHLEWDCLELDDPAADLEGHLVRRLGLLSNELDTQLDAALALGVRITLTGAVDDPAAVERALRALDRDRLVTLHEGTVIFVQKISSRVIARIDLAALAGRSDPPGLLARQILALENPDRPVPGLDDPAAFAAELTEAARRTLGRVDREAVFNDLAGEDADLDPADVRLMLARSGRLALAGLLEHAAAGREDGHAAG